MAEKGTNKKILKNRICLICGKKFDVELEKNGKIPEKYFFSRDLIKELTGGKDATEYWECKECSGFKDDLIIKEKVKAWMENYWGERCSDYEENCPICKAWKYYDYIFKDIEDELTEDRNKTNQEEKKA